MTDQIPFASQSFDTDGAARVLGIGHSKIFEILASGELRSHKIGRARRITGADIDDYRSRCATR